MGNLRVRPDEADQVAFRAAVEAIAGLTVKGSPADEESVREWLGKVFDEDLNQIGPAMHYAQRILHGPKPD